jgi:hypothetical protein
MAIFLCVSQQCALLIFSVQKQTFNGVFELPLLRNAQNTKNAIKENRQHYFLKKHLPPGF